MAFGFGGVNANRKRSNVNSIKNYIISENISDNGYYIILTDFVISKSQDPDKHPGIFEFLVKDLKKASITNYVIVSAISSSKLEKDSTENLLECESTWRQFLSFNEWKPGAILVMGSALRVMAGCADVVWSDFIDFHFNNSFLFMSERFRRVTNKLRIYPTGGLEEVYPLASAVAGDPTCWVTRHFQAQLKNMVACPKSKFKMDDRDYEIIDVKSERSLVSALNKLSNSDLLSVDIETNTLTYMEQTSKIHSIQLCNDGKTAYFFLWDDMVKFKDKLSKCLYSAKKICGSNLKFDTKFMLDKGVDVPLNNIWATDLMSHALNSDLAKGLKPLAFRYTWLGGYDKELEEIKKKLRVENYTQIPRDILLQYSGLDVIACWRIFKALEENIKYVDKKFPNDRQPEWTIWRFIEEIMNPNYHTVIKTEFRGTFFNKKNIEKARSELQKKIDELLTQLVDDLNKQCVELGRDKITKDFPFDSNKELPKLLESLNWPCIERNKDGSFSTADACLEQWKQKGYTAARIMADLRTIKVGIKTFVGTGTDEDDTGWPEYLYDYEDGSYRMHFNTLVMTAESFRHKMRQSNLQQIPSKPPLDKLAKPCISVPAYTNEGSYIKITDDNGKVWTNEYTDWFETARGVVNIKELVETDTILKYAYPPEWQPKDDYRSKRVFN